MLTQATDKFSSGVYMREPRIYKPEIYKGRSIYKGESVYKGNGVYNDGRVSDSEVIYETDFSNFDFINKIDYPKIGNPKAFSFNASYFEKTTVTIDGIEYPCIRHKTSNASFSADFSTELYGEDLYTIETKVYKPSWAGLSGAIEYWGGASFVGSPIISCYSSSRGYGVTRRPADNIVQYYNDFRLLYEAFYYSTQSSIRDINGICVGGATFDVPNNLGKVYLKNKKAIITTGVKGTTFGFYADSNMELCCLGFRIVKKDLFEEMEG